MNAGNIYPLNPARETFVLSAGKDGNYTGEARAGKWALEVSSVFLFTAIFFFALETNHDTRKTTSLFILFQAGSLEQNDWNIFCLFPNFKIAGQSNEYLTITLWIPVSKIQSIQRTRNLPTKASAITKVIN